jgi:hypothetical protein
MPDANTTKRPVQNEEVGWTAASNADSIESFLILMMRTALPTDS